MTYHHNYYYGLPMPLRQENGSPFFVCSANALPHDLARCATINVFGLVGQSVRYQAKVVRMRLKRILCNAVIQMMPISKQSKQLTTFSVNYLVDSKIIRNFVVQKSTNQLTL